MNPTYHDELEKKGLSISGSDQSGEARIVELPSHPFFLGTLFVPQASSAAGNTHPMVLAFLRAATTRSHRKSLAADSLFAERHT